MLSVAEREPAGLQQRNEPSRPGTAKPPEELSCGRIPQARISMKCGIGHFNTAEPSGWRRGRAGGPQAPAGLFQRNVNPPQPHPATAKHACSTAGVVGKLLAAEGIFCRAAFFFLHACAELVFFKRWTCFAIPESEFRLRRAREEN